ncbi:DUF3224 domain-containing protein [Ktedonosporobacter rubrisoli]|uniref:DUF3224 domain-containing protein n=1 Tax=Ktedonosporobacter rubrisoli TaxID=2509675 RepID=A0A4V0YYV1_KTERU|nr:DUF3224 domain-containing protein [Ktedonosporobacter rubrisoli]QBD77501.1 DUF3224 domain-containing protein [Ktedonosporobacter rubrisoli]
MSIIHTTANFKITSWDQTPYDEPEKGSQFFQAKVKKIFEGNIEAESTATLLMCQSEGNSGAGYVATERVVGRIGNRSGSFVIQHGGAMAHGSATDSFGYVVPGSGTDELQGIRGHCSFYHEGEEATLSLDYEIVE